MAVLPDLRRPEADLMPDQPIPPEAAQVAAQIAGRHYLAAYHGGRECPIPKAELVQAVTTALTEREAACWEEARALAGLCSCGHCQLTVREFQRRATRRRGT